MNKTKRASAEKKPADKMRNLVVTVSKSMGDQLTADESRKVFMAVLEKMQQPSLKGNVWEFEAAGRKIRAILKKDYVLRGEDVVSLFLAEDDEWNAEAPSANTGQARRR